MTFTEFLYSLGIKNRDAEPEFAFILLSLIREIFETYGIAITRDIYEHNEDIQGEYDTEISLKYGLIKTITIISGENVYEEGVDYTVDYISGTITILSSGRMNANTSYNVQYSYYIFL